MPSVISRKRGVKASVDPEKGTTSYSATGRKTSIISRLCTRLRTITIFEVNLTLFAVVMALFTLLVIAPAHVKKRRNAILLKQFNDITTSLAAQKASLTQQYEHLQNVITSDNDKLISELYEMIGSVSKDHHEEEVKEKDSEVNQKLAEIHALKAEIQKNKEEMEKVKASIGDIHVKSEDFCGECEMKKMNGITCEARINFLHKQYGTPSQEGMDSIVKYDDSCLRKSG